MMTERRLENGFLDDDISLRVSQIKSENKKLYSIIIKVNLLFYEIESNYEKDNATNVDLYVFTTFSQIHMSFQSYVILLERGLYEDAQIILRSIYDKVFNALYVINDDGALSKMNQDNINEQMSLYRYILNNKLFDYVPEDKLIKGIKELEEIRVLTKNGKCVKAPDNRVISDKLGLNDAYVHYKCLSHYTHNSVCVIDSRIIETEAGFLINQNLNHGNFKEEIIKIIICLKYIVDPICDYINLNEIKKEFNSEIDKLMQIKTEKN